MRGGAIVHFASGHNWARSCENMSYVIGEQPAHPRSLNSTFIVRCLASMISILAISKVRGF